MARNDRIILDQILEQSRQKVAPTVDATRFFEVFSAEQILKDYDLSYDEVRSGIVAGGGDGGIDSFYTLLNGELLREDSDVSDAKKNINIEVFLVQSKTTDSFSESAIEHFRAATEDLFDLNKPTSQLRSVYNESLLSTVERFRTAYKTLASRFPKLRLAYYYVTKGDQVHQNVNRKVSRLESVIKNYFSEAEFSFDFIGAHSLLDLARRAPATTYELKLAENPISSTGRVAYVCLVSLRDFQGFITDSRDRLARNIFEANVRDYQGKTQVNEEIQDSLQRPASEDFWWLNNGITVLASRATVGGKTITIENPEIVNGLQTSTEIFNYFSACNTSSEQRNLLVRVIVPKEPGSRERIIKATNSQTPMQPASLRATDRIHRDIEEYLKPFGFYYDRRKNYYKNEGKPISRIISIPQMAQAVMAIVLQRPDTARARPSSLIKHDDDYRKLFTTEYPIEVYKACIQIVKQTEAFLDSVATDVEDTDKTNIKFYVAMAVAHGAVGKQDPKAQDIASLGDKTIDASAISSACKMVNFEYRRLGGTDQVAKGSELVAALIKSLNKKV